MATDENPSSAAPPPRSPPPSPSAGERGLTRAELHEARAMAALQAIADGANPGLEAYTLANTFTDEHTTALRDRLARLFRRR